MQSNYAVYGNNYYTNIIKKLLFIRFFSFLLHYTQWFIFSIIIHIYLLYFAYTTSTVHSAQFAHIPCAFAYHLVSRIVT